MEELPPERLKLPAPNHSKKRWVLWSMSIFFLAVAVLVFFYYWFWLRFEESTRDAYVGGNQVVVTSQIPGYINAIYADDTDYVTLGQKLIDLDQTDMKIALDKAKSQLAQTIRHVTQLFQKVGELKAEKEKRNAIMVRAGQDYVHRKNLEPSGAVSLEELEHAEAEFIAAMASVLSVEYQLKMAIAEIENSTVETHPLVEKAKQAVRSSWVNLQRCTLFSPVDGIVAARKAQVGEAIKPSSPLMIVVPFDQMWIDANFKEVQLKNVRLNQNAKVTADLYGSSLEYEGTVGGIAAGTGSVFSLLPPQNATGNWIKIVQRLPVRIYLKPEELKANPLRLGLSMHVTVSTKDRSGAVLPQAVSQKPLYQTDIFSKQLAGVEECIEEIFSENYFPALLTEESDEEETQ